MKSQPTSFSEPNDLVDPEFGSRLHEVIGATSKPTTEVQPSTTRNYSGVWLCRLVGFNGPSPEIEVPGHSGVLPVFAVSGQIEFADLGCIVAVAFDRQSLERPIILGKVRADVSSLSETPSCVSVIAENELSLRCGKASITMKADGTVAIRGSNVISRASQTNRIRGGNVQIN